MKDIKKLIASYLEFLDAHFDIESLDKYIYRVVTPFLDRRNDNIVVYVIMGDDGRITLTDDSYTLDDLETSGVSITKKREIELRKILLSYGISRNGNELFVTADHRSFAQKKHNFIQAILSINDMHLLSNEKVQSFFLDDIQSFFDEKGIIYSENISLAGKSNIVHKFDFLIPKQVTEYRKEALIKAINTPKIENTKAVLFSFEDIAKTGRTDKGFVILNDKKRVSEKIYDALESYQITPIHWSAIDSDYKKLGLAA
ncbi:DUF1828 domain-containing protein [Hydrogenimonas sp.]